MLDVLNKIKEELAVIHEKRAQLVEELRPEFPKILSSIFEKSKVIESISWTQYTPYFNDGDSCEFGIYTDCISVNSKNHPCDEEEDTAPIWEEKDYSQESPYLNPNYDPTEGAVVNEFKTVLNSIPDDFYEDLFGDHVMVTVYKDGRIEVDAYDHD